MPANNIANNIYDEESIISLIIEGDENAFTKLFHHYRDQVYNVALKLTRSATIAEEIVEDVFLKIWLKRSSLNEIENFRAYLFAIMRNDVYRAMKAAAKNYTLPLIVEMGEGAVNNAEEYIMGKEYNLILQKAVDRLPGQQKQVYKLMKEENLKREAVAEILNLKPETIKFHLAQAMKNIRSFCTVHLKTMAGALLIFLQDTK